MERPSPLDHPQVGKEGTLYPSWQLACKNEDLDRLFCPVSSIPLTKRQGTQGWMILVQIGSAILKTTIRFTLCM
jgi:hypothetical protein